MNNFLAPLIALGVIVAIAAIYALLAIPLRVIWWLLVKAFWIALGWSIVIYAAPHLWGRISTLING